LSIPFLLAFQEAVLAGYRRIYSWNDYSLLKAISASEKSTLPNINMLSAITPLA